MGAWTTRAKRKNGTATIAAARASQFSQLKEVDVRLTSQERERKAMIAWLEYHPSRVLLAADMQDFLARVERATARIVAELEATGHQPPWPTA